MPQRDRALPAPPTCWYFRGRRRRRIGPLPSCSSSMSYPDGSSSATEVAARGRGIAQARWTDPARPACCAAGCPVSNEGRHASGRSRSGTQTTNKLAREFACFTPCLLTYSLPYACNACNWVDHAPREMVATSPPIFRANTENQPSPPPRKARQADRQSRDDASAVGLVNSVLTAALPTVKVGCGRIEGGRVILRHGGKARDGSDRRSKQKTAHHPWKDD